ncbi:uncharacterized protein LOC144712375 [Wolffia australiana]
MAGESTTKIQLVTLATDALEIASSWVRQTNGSAMEESNEASGMEFEGRPLRMGLGSKVSRIVEIAATDDPVERKLMGKLGVGKRQWPAKSMGISKAHSKSNKTVSEADSVDSEEDESESRASSFAKKSMAAAPAIPNLHKKRKRKAKN